MNKFRKLFSAPVSVVAKALAGIGITPNLLTLTSLLVMTTGFVATVYTRSPLVMALAVSLSGLLDVLDGAVARLSHRVSQKGAFLDSTIDKLNEVLIGGAFAELGINPFLAACFTGLSITVSYVRSRAESLGVRLEGVGLMERAERLIGSILAFALMEFNYSLAELAVAIITLLTGITVVERILYVLRVLS